MLPALIAILAPGMPGSGPRSSTRNSSVPRPRPRRNSGLHALVGFQWRELVERALAKTINGEIRTQDAPFVARALLMTVQATGRAFAWDFVRANWDTMERQYPKHGLRRLAEGVSRAGDTRAGTGGDFMRSSPSGKSISAARPSSSIWSSSELQ